MKGRPPLDLDLEDQILYGLTPARMGYVAIAGMAAIAAFRTQGPVGLRLVACLLLVGLAAVVGWFRYQGRAADDWAVDLVGFALRNYRLEIVLPRMPPLRVRRRFRRPMPQPRQLTLFEP